MDLFTRYYTHKGDTFCNGVRSYAAAYGHELPLKEDGKVNTDSSQYRLCNVNASKLLLDVRIKEKVNKSLLEQFNDNIVDARTSEIILGGRDTDSIQAIKIHNELKGRVIKKVDIGLVNRPLVAKTDAELLELIGN